MYYMSKSIQRPKALNPWKEFAYKQELNKKFRDFGPITRYVSQTIQDKRHSYCRKLIGTYVRFKVYQMVRFLMTLNEH